MIDHLSLQVDDVDVATAWHTAILEPLGAGPVVDFGNAVGFGVHGGPPAFWVGAATDPGGRQAHVAFTAGDRDAVDTVHQAAVRWGGEILHAPREWPEYHPGYYAVFMRDPDGNNVEAVCHRAAS
jgi:catechol 2,3-dioxygenase-like lactoylglutathione lyase family enzyme